MSNTSDPTLSLVLDLFMTGVGHYLYRIRLGDEGSLTFCNFFAKCQRKEHIWFAGYLSTKIDDDFLDVRMLRMGQNHQ